ncbi:GH25 family lysozyme [Clostridium magnum]|uniref:Autolytic lysozyme n=1 Tax=Clostridium magnum DSM 2767 TaxID=1121326 RepID=A0A162UXA8_9CLOT|nr:GH25 family lysozyme [Clostridium magnum]KZL94380.1 autolytic lysozyme [Clostridium magnum DSM 2767]SHJ59692.1 lysozyme [Clostridium magnum DSM 2767]
MKGIDVSNNQGAIDFQQVKNAEVEIVYIKASEGLSFIDPYLKVNYETAKLAGLKVGFYHFLRHNDPVAEAQHFLQAVEGLNADCLYICDIEGDNWSISEASNAVRQFADYLLGQGKKVGIYTGDYFYRDNLSSSVKDLPLWVANYGASKPMTSNYAGHQYSECGSIPGIHTNVDLNNFSEAILVNNYNNILLENVKDPNRIQLIKALQWDLNCDYNAKLKHVDGNKWQETLDALNGIKSIIVKGHKSKVVLWMQQRLVKWGYLKKGSYIDMVYDEPTFQAITNLQKNWGRPTSGILTLETWNIFLNN